MSILVQKWEGYIDDIQGDIFFATLLDLTDCGGDIEYSEFHFSEIPVCDHEFIKIGAIFHWTIEFELQDEYYSISSMLSSTIKFNNKVWTKEQIEIADKKAEEFKQTIWE